MTPSDIMRKAGKMFLEINPPDTKIKWLKKPMFVKYPTGYKGYYAKFRASATGYGPNDLIVTCDAQGFNMMIR